MNVTAPPPPHAPRVLFIRGLMPRSGTNLLSDLLGHHSDVVRSPGNFWEFPPFRFQAELRRYLDCVAATKHAHGFQPDRFLPHVGEAWLRHLVDQPHRLAVFKEPSVDELPAMFAMFPQARALLIVREGRDIVSSLLNSDFVFPKFNPREVRHWRRLLPDEDFRITCRRVAASARTLASFLESSGASALASRWRVVRFEELVTRQEETLRGLVDWLGLPASGMDWAGIRTMPVRGSSFLRNQDGTMNFGEGIVPTEPFLPLGRWKDWSARRQAYYLRVTAPELARVGYPETPAAG